MHKINFKIQSAKSQINFVRNHVNEMVYAELSRQKKKLLKKIYLKKPNLNINMNTCIHNKFCYKL